MKLNRFEFFKKLTLGVTALTAIDKLKLQTLVSEKKISPSIKKVTIVGAGLSGLYSAYLLNFYPV